jgi:hypothetical protein
LHKIRRAMIRPDRDPLQDRVEVDETLVGGARPGKSGRGADGKMVVAGAVETGPGPYPGKRGRKRPLGRLRLAAIPDASAASLEGFITADTEQPLTVTTDGWAGYLGLAAKGYSQEAINLTASWGDASLRLPAIHLVFSLAKRWLLGTHHGAVRPKHLQHYLDEFVW